jgi:glycosyltransferase involved in cell wall biosynthesis
MPKICTIHDLGYLKFTGQFKKYDFWQLKYWTAISVYISKYIISVSESTKKDIVRHYPFASERVVVAYHGYNKKRFNSNISFNDVRRVKKKYGIDEDYILFLSLLKPSKNVEGLLKAYKLLITKYNCKNIKLVIAGEKGWLFESIFKKVSSLGLGKDVFFTDFVLEKDKPALMAGAKVFASPSFWEGFGIHVLEAMACGTPVVVSDVASLPEVVGDAGVMVDPNDHNSIANGLRKVLGMSEIKYNKLVQDTISQAANFSWEKSAKKTLRVLERAYHDNI